MFEPYNTLIFQKCQHHFYELFDYFYETVFLVTFTNSLFQHFIIQ